MDQVGIDNDSYEAMCAVADKDLGVMADGFRSMKADDAENPLWARCLGTIFTYARLYEQATAAYLDALRLDPRSDADMECLALLYNQQREYEKALYYATRAIEANPAAPHYVSNKAVIMRNAGQTAQAIGMLTDCMNDTASYAPFLTDRGMLRACQGDYAGAIRDYDASLDIDPSSAATLLRKGIAQWNLGQKKAARATMRQVVALGYDHWSGTALANAYLGNRRAVEKYISYATGQLRRVDNYLSLAAICSVSGRQAQALDYLSLALRDNALNPDVLQYDQSLQAVRALPAYRTLLASYVR